MFFPVTRRTRGGLKFTTEERRKRAWDRIKLDMWSQSVGGCSLSVMTRAAEEALFYSEEHIPTRIHAVVKYNCSQGSSSPCIVHLSTHILPITQGTSG